MQGAGGRGRGQGARCRVQGAGCRMQDGGWRVQDAGSRWGARQVSNDVGIHRIVGKHGCALPTLHPTHSNVRGAIIRVRVRVGLDMFFDTNSIR